MLKDLIERDSFQQDHVRAWNQSKISGSLIIGDRELFDESSRELSVWKSVNHEQRELRSAAVFFWFFDRRSAGAQSGQEKNKPTYWLRAFANLLSSISRLSFRPFFVSASILCESKKFH